MDHASGASTRTYLLFLIAMMIKSVDDIDHGMLVQTKAKLSTFVLSSSCIFYRACSIAANNSPTGGFDVRSNKDRASSQPPITPGKKPALRGSTTR